MRSSTIHVNPRSHICPDSVAVNLEYASLEFKDSNDNRVVVWARNYDSDETKIDSLQALRDLIVDAITDAIGTLMESAAGAKAPDAADARPTAEGSPPAVEIRTWVPSPSQPTPPEGSQTGDAPPVRITLKPAGDGGA